MNDLQNLRFNDFYKISEYTLKLIYNEDLNDVSVLRSQEIVKFIMNNTDGSDFINIIVDMSNRKIDHIAEDDNDSKMILIKSIKREYKLLKTFVSLV